MTQILRLRASEVIVPANRQRGEFDGEKLSELMESISKNGLLHPIVVRDGNTLVVGERRLRAVANLEGLGEGIRFGTELWEAGYIPAVDFGSLDALQAEEAEFEENIRRVDLTVQERIAATGRLADLRRRQSELLGRPVPTVVSLAEEIRGSSDGRYREDTRRELILSQHLDKPEIAKAKTLDEAWKALKRSEQGERNVELARRVGATFSASQHVLVKDEAVRWMNQQKEEQFDVICTDPPYGMGAHSFGDADGRLVSQTHQYDDSYGSWKSLMGNCSLHWYRIAKPQAHLYVCCDIDRFAELKGILDEVGWECHRTPIINIKKDGSRVPWPQHGPQRKWEIILYAMKGRKPVNKIYPDYMETLGDDNLGHGAQKPVSMYLNLLTRSVVPGNRVLDPFAGTGTLALACHELKCYATMVEQDENYYGIALKRLEALK